MDPVALVFLLAILAVFYLLLIRPQAKRARAQTLMQNSVEVGDRVMLTSGFYGTLVSLADDRIDVALAPEVVVTVARGAIGRVEPRAAVDAEEAGSDAGSEDVADDITDDVPTSPSLTKRDPEQS